MGEWMGLVLGCVCDEEILHVKAEAGNPSILPEGHVGKGESPGLHRGSFFKSLAAYMFPLPR